jgi:nicotinamide mononucleotide transporter
MEQTLQYYITLPITELIAVVASLAYVILAAHKNVWCWPVALVSTVLYTFLFYEVYLWMDSVLQIYYFGMAIYGWYCWRGGFSLSKTEVLPIKTYSAKVHAVSISTLALLSLGIGYLMDTYTPTHFPYLDSATTVFAVFATYLVTKKVIENWLYWIVIDVVSIYLYVEKGLTPTAFLFGCFTVLAVYGYVTWKKDATIDNDSMPEVA